MDNLKYISFTFFYLTISLFMEYCKQNIIIVKNITGTYNLQY